MRRIGLPVAVIAIICALTGCQIHPIPYFTSVPQPSVDRPARYLDPVFSYAVSRNIVYAAADDLDGNSIELKLDLYQPTGDTATARAAMIVVHEGGFATGDKGGALSEFIAEGAAAKGYVVASINYRLLAPSDCSSTGDTGPCRTAAAAATSDAQAAVRWLRANAASYRLDPDRIAMVGMSSGAIVSILAGMVPGLADSPTNSLAERLMSGAPRNTSNPGESSQVTAWVSISGGLPPGITSLDGGLGQAIVDNFSHLPSPGYLFSGTADSIIPIAWGEATRDQLAGIGRIVVFDALQGAGHVPTGYIDEIQSQSAAFLYYMLGLWELDQQPT